MTETKLLTRRVKDEEGNDTGLTPDVDARLVKAIEGGQWPQDAAFACGIVPGTLKRWLSKGCGSSACEPYRGFALRFLHAESKHAAQMFETINQIALGSFDNPKAANVQLHAATWILENRYRWLWNGNALGAAAFITQFLESEDDERKTKAAEMLKKLPEEQKKAFRSEGFLLP